MKRTVFNEDHEAFRASCAVFVDKHVMPHIKAYIEDKAIPREFWLEAGEQKLLGLEIPEEFGGAGAEGFRFNAMFVEELSKASAAFASCNGIHSDITAPHLATLGTQEQKERWLPKVASGECLLAIGMSEPGGGSDLAVLKTTAVRDSDEWVINGSKTFITNGYSADLMLTAVRMSPGKEGGCALRSHVQCRGRGQGQVVEFAGTKRCARSLSARPRRLRIHERIPGARAWRDARVTKIWAGSYEIMKELIGRDFGL